MMRHRDAVVEFHNVYVEYLNATFGSEGRVSPEAIQPRSRLLALMPRANAGQVLFPL